MAKKLTELKIADLVFDRSLQARVKGVEQYHVEDMTAALKKGGNLPPPKVARHRDRLFVTDGWHRCKAHLAAGRKTVACEVLDCDNWGDVMLLATSANKHAGAALKLDAESRYRDAQMTVAAMHAKGDVRSVNWVKEHCGCGWDQAKRAVDEYARNHPKVDAEAEKNGDAKEEAEEEPEFTGKGKDGKVRRKPVKKAALAPKADWKAADAAMGAACRLPEDVARVFPTEKGGQFYSGLVRLMTEAAEQYEKWKKHIQRV